MKKYSTIKYWLLAICCMCLFWVNAMETEAAKKNVKLSDVTFNAEYYYNTYPDLQQVIGKDEQALYNHYINFGIKEGRFGSEEFNCYTYMNNYGDLRLVFGGDYLAYCEHYEKFGKKEGRNASKKQEPVIAENKTLLGTYTTYYDASMTRATNVKVSAERINGIILAPGQEFSYSEVVLPRTRYNGYDLGEQIYGGKIVLGLGGGICQTSSTLYAAMVSAGLPATERYPHSLPVDYVPRHLESAIAQGYKDLKFVNIYDKSIQIVATTDDATGTLTVSIYTIGNN
ncbi:MAG: VanW family protein [Lachnospiraceae bacterium]|nr:VanW family protein [Lachnospiraceae bacterium]